MKKILLAIFSLASIAASAQDRVINDPDAEKRKLSDFHSIQTEDGIDLYLSQGSEENVAVSASKQEYRDKIVTKVIDGVLYLSYDAGIINNVRQNRRLKAYISFKNLQQIKASGGSDITVQGSIAVPSLHIKLSSGSDFSGAVSVNDLNVEQQAGSDVEISGSASTLNINASGGSDFDGYDLKTEIAHVMAAGGSDAELTVNKELVAEASSGSDIEFRGSGILKKSSVGAGASIKKRG